MNLELTIREIADACGLASLAGIREKAVRQDWPYEERQTGPGNPTRFYPLQTLPEKVQTEIIEQCGEELFNRIKTHAIGSLAAPAYTVLTQRLRDQYQAEQARNLSERLDLTSGRKTLAQEAEEKGISQKSLVIALNRANLTGIFYEEVGKASWRERSRTAQDFIRAYNGGGLLPEVHAIVGAISTRTLERWKKDLADAKGDYLALVPEWGKTKGKTSLTAFEMETLVQWALTPKTPRINQAIRQAVKAIQARGIEPKHPRTYQRFLERFKALNIEAWTANREGSLLAHTKVMFDLERDYDKIAVGDILVADGHTLNFTSLDPETGKPKRMTLILFYDMKSNYPVGWEVMTSENVQAIAAALRRAILRLGKVPQIVYLDNGKAFRAKYFTGVKDFKQTILPGLFQQLGISTIFARPYNAQAKVIERFFSTLNDLEWQAPSYVGTGVSTKPPYLKQGEKKIRKLYEEMIGGEVPTIEETHLALAKWFDEYANREVTKGHMKGLKPAQVFEAGRGPGVDAAQLRYWMMRQKPQMIDKNGVRLLGRNYWAPELFGRAHLAVIRYDFQDTRSVLVYDTDGKFICEALRKIKVHPAAEILGTEEDKAEFKRQIKQQRELEGKMMKSCLELYKNHILPQHQVHLQEIGFGDKRGTAIPVEQLEQLPEASPLTAEEKERSAAYLKTKAEAEGITDSVPVAEGLDELKELQFYAQHPEDITDEIRERIDYLLSHSPTYNRVWETLTQQKTG